MKLRVSLLAAALAMFAAPALATEPPGIVSGANVDFTTVPTGGIPGAAVSGGGGGSGFAATVGITGGSFNLLDLATIRPTNGAWLSNFGAAIQNCPLTEDCSVIGTNQYTAEYFKFTADQNATKAEYGLTLDANLNSGLSPNWTISTSFVSGNFAVVGANVYLETVASCTSASSGTGPSGTGSGIADNTCSWNFAGPQFNSAKVGFYFSAVTGSQSASGIWDGALNLIIGAGTPSQFIQTLEIDQTNNSGFDPTVASGKGFFDLSLTGSVGSKPITAYLNIAQGGGAGPNYAAHYGLIIQAPFTVDTVGLELSDFAPVSLCMGCLWPHATHATASIFDNTDSSVGHEFAGTYIVAGILFQPGVIQVGGTAITLGQQFATGTSSSSQILAFDYWNSSSVAANVTLNADGAGQLALGGSAGSTNLSVSGTVKLGGVVGLTECVQASSTGVLSGTGAACGSGTFGSVSNSDGTLTISPTTGVVVASLNLAHANTWTAAISEAQSAGASTPALNVTAANHSAFSIPGAQIIANVDYGSFGDANTTFGLVVGGGKNLDTGATTGSWQLFSARYTGFGGGDGSAFITAGQELMNPTVGSNNNSGRFFGNNPEALCPAGLTPAECTAEEADIRTAFSATVGDRHGLRIVDLGSTGSHATDDSGLSILSSSGIGWTIGIEFGTPSGSFPIVAGGALITTAASSAALNAGIYLQNLTGTPTLAWLALPANTRGLCFGVGNCAAGSVVSTTTSGSGSLVFANGNISINFAAAEVTFTSTGSIQMLGGINAPNATGGTATKFICSDTSGNWFAQTAAC